MAAVPWEVPAGEWSDRECVIIAGGPSVANLTDRDIASLSYGRRVIAVNDAYRRAPWADIVYAADCKWWSIHFATVPSGARLVTIDPATPFPHVLLLGQHHPADHVVLSLDAWRLATGAGLASDIIISAAGGNSGYQALNLAVLLGAQKIGLVGFDLCDGADGRKHWFGDHPEPLNNPDWLLYEGWRRAFNVLAPVLASRGVTVVNLNPESALTAFPTTTVEGFNHV